MLLTPSLIIARQAQEIEAYDRLLIIPVFGKPLRRKKQTQLELLPPHCRSFARCHSEMTEETGAFSVKVIRLNFRQLSAARTELKKKLNGPVLHQDRAACLFTES